MQLCLIGLIFAVCSISAKEHEAPLKNEEGTYRIKFDPRGNVIFDLTRIMYTAECSVAAELDVVCELPVGRPRD